MADTLPPVIALLLGNSDEAVKSLLSYKAALADTAAASEESSGRMAAADSSSAEGQDALAAASEAGSARQVAAAELSASGSERAAKDVKAGLDDAESEAGGFSDRVAGIFKSVGSTMGNWGLPFGEAVSGMGDKIEEAETKGGGFLTSLQQIGKAATVVGAVGIAAVAAESIHLGENYQQATAQLASSAGISVQAATSIGKAFTDTAFKTVFSAQQQIQAYGQVAAQLGTVEGHALTTKEAVTEMNQAGDLAEATNTSLASATSALAAVQQAYGLSANQAAGATNVLFNVARLTAQSVPSVSQAVDKLHTQLGALTPSLGDVGGLLTDLAQHGETGRAAMSAVNTAFTTLLGSSKTTKAAVADLGLSLYTSNGQFVGLGNVIGQLQPKLAGMTQAQQLATLSQLFGASSARKMLDVVLAGPAAYQKATAAVTAANSAHEAAEKQSQTLSHEVETLVSGLEDEGVKLGTFLIPKLQILVGVITNVVNWFLKHKLVMEIVAGVIGTVLVAAIGAYIAGMVAAAAATVAAAAPILAIVAAVALVVAGFVYAYTHFKTFKDIVNEVAAVLKDVLVAAFQIAKVTIEFLIQAVQNVWDIFKDFVDFFVDIFQGKWGAAWDALKDIPVKVLGIVIDAVRDFGPMVLSALEALGGLILRGLLAGIEAYVHLLWDFWTGLPRMILSLLGSGLGLLTQWGKDLLNGLLAAVKFGLTLLWDLWTKVPLEILSLLGDGAKILLHWGEDLLNGAVNGILAYVHFLWDFWTSLPGKVLSLLGQGASWLLGFGKDVLRGLVDGIESYVSFLWNFWTSLPGKVLGFFSGAASWLFNAGKQLIEGLINGIINAAGNIGSAVGHVVGSAIKGIPIIGSIASHLGIPGIATGGYVSQPTLAMVGEDEPEWVIPASKIAAVANRSNIASLPAVPAAVPQTAAAGSFAQSGPTTIVMQIDGQTIAKALIPPLRSVGLQTQRVLPSTGLWGR